MYDFLVRHVKRMQKTPKHCETKNRWFLLPREIRDMIYRELLCKRYLIHRSARWKQGKAFFHEDTPFYWFRGRHYYWRSYWWSGHVFMRKRPLFWADVSLLLTSKAISQEAIEIMYEGSVFTVYVGQPSLRFYRLTPLPPQHLLDRIQNIEMETCVCDTLDFKASEVWFKNFNAGHIKRNSCRINFPCYYCLLWCEDEGGSHAPFFRACQSLVGFKTVTLDLELLCADADEEDELVEVYSSMREDFKDALEPSLGPSRGYDVGQVFSSEFHSRIFSLEFNPRNHLENVQAARPKCGGQVLLLEEGTDSGAAA